MLEIFFRDQKQSTYDGIALSDLNRIEAKYDINIRVLSVIPKKANIKVVSSKIKKRRKVPRALWNE